MAKKYHISCGMAGIYAGETNAKGTEWKNKSDCTTEAIEAVRDYLVDELSDSLDGDGETAGYTWNRKDGKTVELIVRVRDTEPKN